MCGHAHPLCQTKLAYYHCEDLPLILSLSKDHPELVEPRGNPVEVEHTSANRRCYGDEIANPRIEYGVAMTKWVRMSLRGVWKDAE